MEQSHKRFILATPDLLCLVAVFGGIYFFSPSMATMLGLGNCFPLVIAGACLFDLVLLFFLLSYCEPEVSLLQKIDFFPWRKSDVLGLLLEIPVFYSIVFFLPFWYLLLENLFPGIQETSGLLYALEKAPGFEKIILMVHVLFFAPLIEEILFRKLLFQMLERINFYFACIAVSLLFAVCHFALTPLAVLFWLGLCQQTFYCRHGNLSCAVAFHSLYNAVILVISSFQPM